MELDTKLVYRAREEFLETGSVNERISRALRPDILTSWRRSKVSGAQTGVNTLLPFNDDLDRDGRLVRAAEPVLRALAGNLAGHEAGVLLADREANILKRWVDDTSILPELDRICSDSGFGAPEDRVGTNGIGTVAELGRACMVIGPEHYADTLVSFTCVGAPIHSPTTRRLEGLITLSCRADAANALLTPLMVSAAADISYRLLEAATIDERRMLDAYVAARRPNRLVAAVGRDVLIADARVTRLLDNLTHRDVLWDVVSEVVRESGPSNHVLETNDGATVISLTCEPIHNDSGRLVGAIVEIDAAPAASAGAERPRRPQTRTLELPGRNPRWLHILEAASRYADGRVDVTVTGEQGSGKWTLVKAMVGAELDAPTTCAVTCGSPDAPNTICDALSPAPRPLPRLLLLHNLDALPERSLPLVSSLLDRRGDGPERPWIVATLSPPSDDKGESLDRIVDQLGGVRLTVPALRQRPDDIPIVARHLLERHDRADEVHLSSEAMAELSRAQWPGNIQQLDGVLRAVTAGRLGEITAADLPPEVRAGSTRRSLSPIEEIERAAIVQALHEANGNKVAAAKIVGLSRSTIYRKMRAYGIDRDAGFF